MRGIARSFLVSLWFMFLTFPLLAIKVNATTGLITWRLENTLYMGVGIFFLSFIWRALLVRKGITTAEEANLTGLFTFLRSERRQDYTLAAAVFIMSLVPLGSLLISTLFAPAGKQVRALTAHDVILPIFGFAVACLCFAGKRRASFAALKKTGATLTQPGLPRLAAMGTLLAFLIPLPFLVDIYQVNVLSAAFIWIMLGLGLNIVVGQTGLLVLGYVAFYAVGAYAYALCNQHFGGEFFGFWLMLPVGGLLAAVAGIALCLPVLRLRGDYLAIVTLGFGEIVRVVLESGNLSLAPLAAAYSLFGTPPAWMTASLNLGGPAGISNIPYPGFFGIPLNMDASIHYVYYIGLGLTIITIVAVARLRDSRLGRSWMALREDEIACEAMGINKAMAKLTSFALGACWAGFGGVLFAAKTSFINPTSFTFMESALILSVVVLGGLGSILGVVLGACVLILLPEYLRSFDEYRMLIFGASMVLMMVFRPQGLITPSPKRRFPTGATPDGVMASAAAGAVEAFR